MKLSVLLSLIFYNTNITDNMSFVKNSPKNGFYKLITFPTFYIYS